MARDGLLPDAARDGARQGEEDRWRPCGSPAWRSAQNGSKRTCDVVVIPFTGAADDTRAALRRAVRGAGPGEAQRRKRRTPGGGPQTPRVEQRRVPKARAASCAATKEYLQTVIEEHGRTNEELGTANEELVSGNEELQSMNEELETAKEELQSINEELTTVNDELQNRNHEVTPDQRRSREPARPRSTSRSSSSTAQRRIRRFTPKARRILNVLPDRRRAPVRATSRPNIDVSDLDHQIAEVIETMVVQGVGGPGPRGPLVSDADPALQDDRTNRIDGAILSLVDIDALKHLVEGAASWRTPTPSARTAPRTSSSRRCRTSSARRSASMLMHAQLLRRGDIDEAEGRGAPGRPSRPASGCRSSSSTTCSTCRGSSTGKLSMTSSRSTSATVVSPGGGRPEPRRSSANR